MWNRTVLRRLALSLSALLLSVCVPALPFAAARQASPAAPAAPQSPAEKAETEEFEQIRANGNKSYDKGDYPAAIKVYEAGLAKAQALQNEKYIAQFFHSIGAVCLSLGQNDKALDYFQRAMTLREKIGSQLDIAASLNSIGAVYYRFGQNDKALDFYQRALTIREKAGSQSDIAQTLNNIGAVCWSLGRNDKALDYFQRTLTLNEKIGNPQSIADSLNNLGRIYSTLGQNEKALDCHRRALPLYEQIGNPQSISYSLDSIGIVYSDLGQNEKALDYFQRALTIKEKIGNQSDIAASLNGVGSVYSTLGRNDKALDYYQRAMPLLEKIGNSENIAQTLNNIGVLYYDLGQNDKALDYHQRALAFREKIGNQLSIARSLNNLGVVYAAQKQWDKAEDAYSQARRTFESFSQQVEDPTELADLQQTMSHFYERYADLLAQEKRPDAALALLEAGRAKGVARQLFLNRSGFSNALTPEESANLKQRLSEMNAANNRLHTAMQKQAAAPKDQQAILAEHTQKARDAERKYDAYNAELFKRHPQFRSESGDITVSPEDLRSLADNNPDTLFLTWAMLDEKRADLYVIGKREKERVQGFTLSVGETKLGEMAAAWRAAIVRSGSGMEPHNAPEAEKETGRAKALYNTLLGPLEKAGLLAKGRYKRLVVVPSGPLLEIPFAALMDGAGRRLIEDYAVSSKVALSTSFWRANPVAAKTNMLCIADPIGTAPTKEEKLAMRRAGFGPLPGARREGLAVAGLFHASPLVGPQAKKADVLRAMTGVKLLHFATHGYLNAKNPFYSGLVLAPEPAGSSDDGVLSAREILNLSLAAKMAALSACETGRGVAKGGDGLQGLVWAFQAAGCPCVVASQWQVDDAATKDLMLTFYKEIQAGKRKDDAMRAAMLGVKAQKPPPFFWAAFQVIGDTAPLQRTGR